MIFQPSQWQRSWGKIPPPGTQYILAVTDPHNVLGDFDPKQNVSQPLQLPDLSIIQTQNMTTGSVTGFDWNRDRNATLDLANHRGVNFGYSIAKANLPVPTDIAFYWSPTATYDPNTAVLVTDMSGDKDSPATMQLTNQAVGDYALQGPNDPNIANFNDPGRWGTPPAGAQYLLAVADPDTGNGHKIIEARPNTDPTVSYRAETVKSLQLATPRQLLGNSVQVLYQGSEIEARFVPGIDDPQGIYKNQSSFPPLPSNTIPMSEAEVVLGVDHFNWLQQVSHLPVNWTPYTVGIDYNNLPNLTVNPTTGQLYYADTKSLPSPYYQIQTPFLDPIVLKSDPGYPATATIPSSTRVFLVNNLTDPTTGAPLTDPTTGKQVLYSVDPWLNGQKTTLANGDVISSPYPDQYYYYFNEEPVIVGGSSTNLNYQDHTYSTGLSYTLHFPPLSNTYSKPSQHFFYLLWSLCTPSAWG
jgi:hypothetical protein